MDPENYVEDEPYAGDPNEKPHTCYHDVEGCLECERALRDAMHAAANHFIQEQDALVTASTTAYTGGAYPCLCPEDAEGDEVLITDDDPRPIEDHTPMCSEYDIPF